MKENIRWSLASREERDKKDKDRMRGVFFCLGYSTPSGISRCTKNLRH
jgi:hypothetical protein